MEPIIIDSCCDVVFGQVPLGSHSKPLIFAMIKFTVVCSWEQCLWRGGEQEGQMERLSWDAVATAASASPTGSSRAGTALWSGPELKSRGSFVLSHWVVVRHLLPLEKSVPWARQLPSAQAKERAQPWAVHVQYCWQLGQGEPQYWREDLQLCGEYTTASTYRWIQIDFRFHSSLPLSMLFAFTLTLVHSCSCPRFCISCEYFLL